MIFLCLCKLFFVARQSTKWQKRRDGLMCPALQFHRSIHQIHGSNTTPRQRATNLLALRRGSLRHVAAIVIIWLREIMPGIASATGLLEARIRPTYRPKPKVFIENSQSISQVNKQVINKHFDFVFIKHFYFSFVGENECLYFQFQKGVYIVITSFYNFLQKI